MEAERWVMSSTGDSERQAGVGNQETPAHWTDVNSIRREGASWLNLGDGYDSGVCKPDGETQRKQRHR